MSFPPLYQAESSTLDRVYQLGNQVYEAQTLHHRSDLSPRILASNYDVIIPALPGLPSHPILVISQNGYGLFGSKDQKLVPLYIEFPVESDAVTDVISLVVPSLPYQIADLHPADINLPRFDEKLFDKCVRLSNSASPISKLQLLQV